MDLGIAGKWALVCGASKGLGFGSAKALVEDGVNVVINARTDAALQQAATQLRAAAAQWASATGQKSPEVLAVACDITTEEGRAAVFSVPLDFFRQDPREHTHRIDYQGRSWYVPSYRFGVYKIWGLTAIMIVELMNLLYDDVNINLHTPPERFITF